MCPRAWISKKLRADRHLARVQPIALVLKDVSGLRRHTVDAPVGLAIVVADGDAEPAIVGSHDLDRLLGIAGHHQLVAFASVSSSYGRLPRGVAAFVLHLESPREGDRPGGEGEGRQEKEKGKNPFHPQPFLVYSPPLFPPAILVLIFLGWLLVTLKPDRSSKAAKTSEL